MKNNGFTLRKRIRSFRYAFRGIGSLIRHEHNAWIHCFVSLCVIGAGIWLGLSRTEWMLICLCIGMVLSAEAFNSAIETLADRVSSQYDEAIGRVKDLAAGGVLLLAIASVIIGLNIFIPKLYRLLA